MIFSSLALLALSSVASAHFRLYDPYWRGANVDQSNSSTNRTAWPLDGGSLLASFSHPWAHTYVNLGLGNEVTAFNISLVQGFNQTGNGTFCWSKTGQDVLKGLNLAEGQNASIQVIQISHSGGALYNCADITFSGTAKLLDAGVCKNGTGVGGVALQNAGTATSGNGSAAASGAATGDAASLRMKGGVVVGGLVVAGFWALVL
ncbi:Lysophospholipase 1 [Venturia nashicola]|uniref:Lysophospholipase 1 n=1 Tax=Venturia nashicola TaxID=86259 RepID=A0A4Z1P2N2_9PEZI|nr:Lysophospholipase 1 [Venturia nashicola]